MISIVIPRLANNSLIRFDDCKSVGDEGLSEQGHHRSARRPRINTGLRGISGADVDQSAGDQTETDDWSTTHPVINPKDYTTIGKPKKQK